MPLVSIVIPAYNRTGILGAVLRNVAGAIEGIEAEVIVVDDGSNPPLGEDLSPSAGFPLVLARQPNQGCVVAKQTGMLRARGEYIQFLDSDDLLAPGKLHRQIDVMESTGSDVSYTDLAYMRIHGNRTDGSPYDPATVPKATLPEDFYLRVQPAPHCPLYRRDYLMRHLATPMIPPSPLFGSIGEVWMYYNLCLHEARIIKIDGHLAWSGVTDSDRLTNHWERLGIASLVLTEEFLRCSPASMRNSRAFRIIAERAFLAWRKLPTGTPAAYRRRLYSIATSAGTGHLRQHAGRLYRSLSRVIGTGLAGELLRPIQRPSFARIGTMSRAEFEERLEIATRQAATGFAGGDDGN